MIVFVITCDRVWEKGHSKQKYTTNNILCMSQTIMRFHTGSMTMLYYERATMILKVNYVTLGYLYTVSMPGWIWFMMPYSAMELMKNTEKAP